VDKGRGLLPDRCTIRLLERGLTVWLDEIEMMVGTHLGRRSINRGGDEA
jgi:hypothetical protein